MKKFSSRTADKFVVRFPDGMRSLVVKASEADHMSMNTFVVQACKEKLDREHRQELLLKALAAQVQAGRLEMSCVETAEHLH